MAVRIEEERTGMGEGEGGGWGWKYLGTRVHPWYIVNPIDYYALGHRDGGGRGGRVGLIL